MELIVAIKSKASADESTIDILELQSGSVTVAVVGTTPLIFNRLHGQTQRVLLLGGGKKTIAERHSNLKHDPASEFRDSVYRMPNASAKTLLAAEGSWFKGALKSAALDMPGTKKTEIGRLCWVVGSRIELYGIPRLMMATTRSADINRTPDIRTRAQVDEWACILTIQFVRPKLNETSVVKLLAAAGIVAGVGDWRQQKGGSNFGQFRLVPNGDPDIKRIMKAGGRKAQEEALQNIQCANDETAELFDWFCEEVERRGKGNMLRQDNEIPDDEEYAAEAAD